MSGGGICSCEDARWIEVAPNCARRRAFVLAMSKFTVMLLQSSLISKMDLEGTGIKVKTQL